MAEGNIATFGLAQSDRTDWPPFRPGLRPRTGWELGEVTVPTKFGKQTVAALLRNGLAVHEMVDSEGFAISHQAKGLRITCGGLVFAASDGACYLAEAHSGELLRFAVGDESAEDRRRIVDAFERADADHLTLRDRVMVS